MSEGHGKRLARLHTGPLAHMLYDAAGSYLCIGLRQERVTNSPAEPFTVLLLRDALLSEAMWAVVHVVYCPFGFTSPLIL